MNTYGQSARGALSLGVAAGVIWLGFMAQFIHRSSLATPDTANYLECAENLALMKGCLVTPWSDLTVKRWETMAIFPPGYPILVAPLIALGVPPLLAGAEVSIVSGALFFVVLGLLVWRMLPPTLSILVVALIMAMHILWTFSSSAISDVPFLFFAAASLWAMLEGTQSPGGSGWWLFTAGLLAGGAYVIRTAGLGLLGAQALFLLIGKRDLRTVTAQLGYWAGGMLLATVPLFARNWIVFHSPVPYSMPPSTKGLLENLRDMLAAVIADLAGTKHAGDMVHSSTIVLMGVAVAGLLGLGACLRYGSDPIKLLTIYAGAYCGLILLWRTKYDAEQIGSRYMVQIDWILWVLVAFGAASWISAGYQSSWRKWAAVLAFVVPLFLLQARLYFQKSDRPLENPDLLSSSRFLQKELREGQIVLSTRAYYLRIVGSVNARYVAKNGGAPALGDVVAACQSGLLWGLDLDDLGSVGRGEYGPAVQAILNGSGESGGFSAVRISDQSVTIRCRPWARR